MPRSHGPVFSFWHHMGVCTHARATWTIRRHFECLSSLQLPSPLLYGANTWANRPGLWVRVGHDPHALMHMVMEYLMPPSSREPCLTTAAVLYSGQRAQRHVLPRITACQHLVNPGWIDIQPIIPRDTGIIGDVHLCKEPRIFVPGTKDPLPRQHGNIHNPFCAIRKADKDVPVWPCFYIYGIYTGSTMSSVPCLSPVSHVAVPLPLYDHLKAQCPRQRKRSPVAIPDDVPK